MKRLTRGKPYPLYPIQPLKDFNQMIERQCEKNPGQPAFVWKEKKEIHTVSFKAFKEELFACLEYLDQEKLAAQAIALAAGNSYEWIVLFLSIILSGGLCIVINPGLSSDEIKDQLQFVKADALLYDRHCSLKSEECPDPIRMINMKSIRKKWTDKPITRDFFMDQNPDRDACIFFTSGTTTRAKAVVLSQKNMCADIYGASRLFEPHGSTVSLLPFYHSFGLVTAILKPFNYHVTTYISPSLRRMMQDIKNNQPNTLFMVPLMVETIHKRIMSSARKSNREKKMAAAAKLSNLLLKAGIDVRRSLFSDIHEQFGRNLEYIICGGALLDQKYIDDFRTWGIQILNGYGITECSPCASVNRNEFQKAGSVGQLCDGLQAKVNKKGEILLKGDCIFSRYLKEPELTREVFEDGWFNTGDIGYVDEDGFLFLQGRSKNLIILSNGENISPEQFELDLQEKPGISEIVVYGQNQHIVCEIYPEEDQMGNQSYFDALIKEWNQNRPADHRIAQVILRDTPFEKTGTQKIIRHQIHQE